MNFPEQDFRRAKVGNTVWSSIQGPGKIIAIEKFHSNPIVVRFDNGCCRRFKTNGKEFDTTFWPELFSAEPALLLQPVAKQEEEAVEAWEGTFPNGNTMLFKEKNLLERADYPGLKLTAHLTGTRRVPAETEWELVEGFIPPQVLHHRPSCGYDDWLRVIYWRPRKVEK